MNYRHAYHAGSFADVFKHYVLVLLIKSLLKKATPFTYIDTHSGRGFYDLSSELSEKTAEAKSGIQLLWDAKLKSESLQSYLRIIKGFQSDHQNLRYYPGSPKIVHSLLRAEDRMILNEFHPEEARLLKNEFKKDKRVSVHAQNAYQWLSGAIPPSTNRGLVFIDPPYEKPNEYPELLKLLKMALKRWKNGTYALWYPMTKDQRLKPFYAGLKEAGITEILNTQLNVYETDSPIGLNGSGVLIINPPWQLEEQLKLDLKELWGILSPERKGGFSCVEI